MVTDQLHNARHIFTLSKRLEEILHDRFEIIATRIKNGTLEPAEIDALVDETRNQIIMPVAQFIKRSAEK